MMFVAALAIPLAGATAAFGSSQAWAAAKAKGPNGKVTCSTVTGNVLTTITVSGCSNFGSALFSSSSDATSVGTLSSGGTVVWSNGDSVTFNAPNVTLPSAKHCPGYVKPAKGQPAPTEPTAAKFSGVVTADVGGLKLPGKFKGEVCISQTNNITAAKPMSFT